MTIPIGTLCEIVQGPFPRTGFGSQFIGRFGIVAGPPTNCTWTTPNVIAYPLDIVPDGFVIAACCLRPVAPPGDPDRVDTPEREPIEVLR